MASHSGLTRQNVIYGTKGAAIDYSGGNVELGTNIRYVVVTAEGDLVIHPLDNSSGNYVTFTGCPVGFVPPYRVKAIIASGSTASVASIS